MIRGIVHDPSLTGSHSFVHDHVARNIYFLSFNLKVKGSSRPHESGFTLLCLPRNPSKVRGSHVCHDLTLLQEYRVSFQEDPGGSPEVCIIVRVWEGTVLHRRCAHLRHSSHNVLLGPLFRGGLLFGLSSVLFIELEATERVRCGVSSITWNWTCRSTLDDDEEATMVVYRPETFSRLLIARYSRTYCGLSIIRTG
jgi:hypothetical protein